MRYRGQHTFDRYVPSPFFHLSFSGPRLASARLRPPSLLASLHFSFSFYHHRPLCANWYPFLFPCTRKHLVAVDLKRANPSTAKQPIISLQRYASPRPADIALNVGMPPVAGESGEKSSVDCIGDDARRSDLDLIRFLSSFVPVRGNII